MEQWGGVKATKVNASFSVATGCTWDSGTNTFGFTAVNGWQILSTGLPSGDITGYSKIHVTLSSMSDNIDNIRLRIKDTSDKYADYNLVEGENNVDLTALAAANPTCDFTSINDITIWSPTSAAAEKTVDGEHAASVVITNAYIFSPTLTIKTATGFDEEITDLSYLTGGGDFVIAKADGSKFQAYIASEAGASAKSLSEYSDDLYYFFSLDALPALDVDDDGNADATTYYRIAIKNEKGVAKPNNWWGDNHINVIGGWNAVWSAWCDDTHDQIYGRDGKFYGIWTVSEYEEGKGFKIQNPATNYYLTVNGRDASETYLKLYKGLSISSKTVLDVEKFDNAADDQIFALADAVGYNAETGVTTNATWTFGTPVDISNWDYLMITTVNNPSDGSHEITITDDDGISVHGEGYSGGTAGTGGNMWLDRWNNQNAIRISIDYLRINKEMDITKIKSFRIGGTTKIANVYLTDYNNTKINGGYKDGDLKREYTETGKFGTVCLPYVASYSGAEVYSITGKGANSISLTKVTGLLEAGKPYFYKSTDEVGKDNAGTTRNVNFFRADLAKFDAASAGTDYGLIGTFSDTKAPLKSYVLSSNKLYQVDAANAVTIGANKAYVDLDAISPSLSRGNVFIDFDEPTGIRTVKGAESMSKESVFFDLQGRRVAQPVKGMYIVNGKKVMVK